MSAGMLMKPEELAARYGVAKSTVLEWYHKGMITAEVAVGKVYRFDADKVAAELRKHAAKKTPKGKMGHVI